LYASIKKTYGEPIDISLPDKGIIKDLFGRRTEFFIKEIDEVFEPTLHIR
tara:strand:- start:3181 stop:3330 length:150 start_codon:yes stop_codon:yes gene_type:complete